MERIKVLIKNKIISMAEAGADSKIAKKNYIFKVIILGDQGVGKTSVLQTFVRGNFNQVYKPTIGADFHTKKLVLDEKHITLQIWDTAGQERF